MARRTSSALGLQLLYIQEIQVVAQPKWQVYTGAPCGGQKDLSLNMHSQRDMNYTHRAARGDVAIPVACRDLIAVQSPSDIDAYVLTNSNAAMSIALEALSAVDYYES